MRKILNGSFRSPVVEWDSAQIAVEKFVKEGFEFDVPPGVPATEFHPLYSLTWFADDKDAPSQLVVDYTVGQVEDLLVCRKCGGYINKLRWLLCPVFSRDHIRPFAFRPRQFGILAPYCEECDEPAWTAGPGVWVNDAWQGTKIVIPKMMVNEKGEIAWVKG